MRSGCQSGLLVGQPSPTPRATSFISLVRSDRHSDEQLGRAMVSDSPDWCSADPCFIETQPVEIDNGLPVLLERMSGGIQIGLMEGPMKIRNASGCWEFIAAHFIERY